MIHNISDTAQYWPQLERRESPVRRLAGDAVAILSIVRSTGMIACRAWRDNRAWRRANAATRTAQ